MNDEIEITSTLFPSYENEDLNIGRFGKRLAEYVKEILESNNIVVTDIYPTDFAYELKIKYASFNFYITCGNIDSEIDEFLMYLEIKVPFYKKFLKSISSDHIISEIYSLLMLDFKHNPEIEITDLIDCKID